MNSASKNRYESRSASRPLPATRTRIQRGSVSGQDVSGNRLSNAPSFNANATVDWTVSDGPAGRFSIHPTISYQSSQFFEVLNVPRLRQKAYALLGGRIDWESANGRYTLSIWGKNLTNKFYFTSRVDLLAGTSLVAASTC